MTTQAVFESVVIGTIVTHAANRNVGLAARTVTGVTFLTVNLFFVGGSCGFNFPWLLLMTFYAIVNA